MTDPRNINILTLNTGILDEAPNNPNSMEPDDYALLVESIRRVGFLEPLLVRPHTLPGGTHQRYEVLGGHHRLRAAKEVGLCDIPCVVRQGTDDATADVIRVGMNRLRGSLDLTKVAGILADLSKIWPLSDLTITGFNASEIEDLIAAAQPMMDVDALMEQPVDVADDKPPKPFVLEIEFRHKEEYTTARRMLKRAAGHGGDLGTGLLSILGNPTKE